MPRFQFSICKHIACESWPMHGHITSGNHPSSVSSVPLFSKTAAMETAAKFADEGLLEEGDPQTIIRVIDDTRLPMDQTTDDRAFSRLSAEVAYVIVGRRYGTIEPEANSGDEVRIEQCAGRCGHKHCTRMPVHAVLYFKGIAVSPPPYFSHEVAMANIQEAVDTGLFTAEEEDRLITQLGKIALAEKTMRVDRMIQSLSTPYSAQIASYILGLEEWPKGVQDAEFIMCDEDGPLRHGHFKAYGIEVGESVFNKPNADRQLMQLVDHGLIESNVAVRIAAQIEAAQLPRVAAVDKMTDAVKEFLTQFHGAGQD